MIQCFKRAGVSLLLDFQQIICNITSETAKAATTYLPRLDHPDGYWSDDEISDDASWEEFVEAEVEMNFEAAMTAEGVTQARERETLLAEVRAQRDQIAMEVEQLKHANEY
jgi:hypothetical protein